MPTPTLPDSRLRLSVPAFTLIELLVVITIIGIIVGIAFPLTQRMTAYSSGEAGVNSVSTAVNAARIYNHRLGNLPDMSEVGEPFPSGADYSGTAALFTPGGEIRLVINGIEAQRAHDQNGDGIEPDDNAYTDIDTDYVQLPAAAGIAGVTREGGSLRIIPPPFAIRFNEAGQLANDEQYIYYDGDHDGEYERPDAPDSNFDPDAADPRRADVPQTDGVYHIPYEEIPTVSAVILFDANDFRGDDDVSWDSHTDAERLAWFDEEIGDEPRGTVIYFNPSSGAMLRQD